MISNSNDHEGMDHPAWKILPEHTADDPLCSDETIPSSSSAVLYIMTGKELVSDKDGDCLRYSSENTTPEDFTAVEANQHSCCGIVAASSLQSVVKASTGAPDMAPQAEHLLWNVGAAGVSASGASETEWGKEKAGLIMATEAEGLATSMASTTKADVEILADSSQQGAPKDNPLPNESFQDITFKDDDAANAATTNDDITSTVELTESLKAIGAGKEWVLKFLTTALPEQQALRGLGMEEARDASIPASEVEEAGEPIVHYAKDTIEGGAHVLPASSEEVSTDAVMVSVSMKEVPLKDVDDLHPATTAGSVTIVDELVPTETMEE